MAKQATARSDTFGSILDRPATEFDRPPPMPVGTYVCMVKGEPRRDKSTKKGTEYIEFNLQFLEAGEDVDANELKALGGIKEKQMKLTFYITDNSGYRCQEFLRDDLGIDIEGQSLWDAAQEAKGQSCLVTIRQKPRDDGKGMFSEIGGTAPVGE